MLPELTTSVALAPLTYARRAEPAELPELMDGPLPYPVIRDYLRDLAKVNRITRGYQPTLAFLERMATARDSSAPLRILDVGSGGGDTLRVIARWAARRKLPVELTGIDLNPNSARIAAELGAGDPLAASINFITADIFTFEPQQPPDVILSALFTHHLSSPEIVRFLSWMEQHARLGWFVNDLRRSQPAARWFRFLPGLLGWHRYIGHDGPISLRRAFRADDWQRFLAAAGLAAAGIANVSIESHPMCRLCVARIRGEARPAS